MRALSASELLSVWELGSRQLPLERAFTMLAVVCPEISSESLARLTIGQRDARLLALREMTFGSEIRGVTDCPECGETIELTFNSSDFLPLNETESPAELAVKSNGSEVRFRLPIGADLLAVRSAEQLLERCLLSGGDKLTENIRVAVAERMSNADPMADIHLALNCPNCEHKWAAPFDIVAFLWREITAAARRLLREVHTLASAYGWTESEILALSPARRRAYLEMASG
jgi:uncharacterized protein (UPF0212 family)